MRLIARLRKSLSTYILRPKTGIVQLSAASGKTLAEPVRLQGFVDDVQWNVKIVVEYLPQIRAWIYRSNSLNLKYGVCALADSLKDAGHQNHHSSQVKRSSESSLRTGSASCKVKVPPFHSPLVLGCMSQLRMMSDCQVCEAFEDGKSIK